MECMMGMECGMGMMVMMWLFWAVLIGLAGWGLYRLFTSTRSASPGGGAGAPHETPLETLERRYAEGEVTTEEFQERKSRLAE